MATIYDDTTEPDPRRIEKEVHDSVNQCRVVMGQYRRRLLELSTGGHASAARSPAVAGND